MTEERNEPKKQMETERAEVHLNNEATDPGKQKAKRNASLTRCLQDIINTEHQSGSDNYSKRLLTEIRDGIGNLEKIQAKRLKLRQLELQVKYPEHVFSLNSDSDDD